MAKNLANGKIPTTQVNNLNTTGPRRYSHEVENSNIDGHGFRENP